MVTAATTLAPPHPDAWVGVDEDGDTVALAIINGQAMTWVVSNGAWCRVMGDDGIIVAWGKAMAARAEAERKLRLMQFLYTYAGAHGTTRVARHVDVISAENALLAAGGKL